MCTLKYGVYWSVVWQVDQQGMQEFVQSLEVPDHVKAELLKLTPHNYIGLAAELARKV